MSWKHQLYLDARQSSCDDGVIEVLRGEEVGRLNTDRVIGTGDHIDDRLLDGAPHADRPPRDELDRRGVFVGFDSWC